jgi:O-antigen/teichoic acid export membrane protein
MLIGFLITPFLVRHLGDSTYGLWIIIGSLTGYFGALDLGVGNSVGRNVAFCRARQDIAGVNGILSTAFFYLCGIAVLSLLATLGVLVSFVLIFKNVEPTQLDAARLALALVGLNFALTLPLNTFDGILWGYQRFDLQNKVDIPILLVRTGLTYWLIGAGQGLVALALITLLSSVAGLLTKALLAFRLEPALRVSIPMITRDSAKGLFGYGVWLFPSMLLKQLTPALITTIIGSALEPARVTPFSIASKLVAYAINALNAATSIFTPLATALHARDDHDQQRTLFLMGSRGCLAFALLFTSLFVFLGQPLLLLWIGPALATAFPLLLILAAGELLPMSQFTANSILLGKGRLGILAFDSLLEMTVSGGLTLLVIETYDLPGVCVAIAAPAFLFRGLVPMVFTCRVVGVPLATYLMRVILPILLLAAGPVVVLALVTSWRTPNSWIELFLYGGFYSILYLGVMGVGIFGIQGVSALLRRARPQFSRSPSAITPPAEALAEGERLN